MSTDIRHDIGFFFEKNVKKDEVIEFFSYLCI